MEAFERLARYANDHGKPEAKPFFSIDGRRPLTGEEWGRMRAKFFCEHAVTNVWDEPAMRGEERLKDRDNRCVHLNQKPLLLLERIIRASSEPGDVVWEPFGGLCTAAVACLHLDRTCFSAEINPSYYDLATTRLESEKRYARLREKADPASAPGTPGRLAAPRDLHSRKRRPVRTASLF